MKHSSYIQEKKSFHVSEECIGNNSGYYKQNLIIKYKQYRIKASDRNKSWEAPWKSWYLIQLWGMDRFYIEELGYGKYPR